MMMDNMMTIIEWRNTTIWPVLLPAGLARVIKVDEEAKLNDLGEDRDEDNHNNSFR